MTIRKTSKTMTLVRAGAGKGMPMEIYVLIHKGTHYKTFSGNQCHFISCLGPKRISCHGQHTTGEIRRP